MTGTSALDRSAAVLGVLAALTAVGASVVVGLGHLRDDVGAAGTSAPVGAGDGHAFVGGRVVTRGGVSFEVPSPDAGWTVEDRGTVAYYVDRTGRPAVGVAGPAVFRAGYCAAERAGSNRGFVGVTRPTTGRGLRGANVAAARHWLAAVSLEEDRRTSSPHTRLRTSWSTLADGTVAVRTSARIAVTEPQACDAPYVEVTVVSLASGRHRFVHLVLVRDAGAPGTLRHRVAERIVQSLRTRT